MDLDHMLRDAAPRIADRTAETLGLLDELVSEIARSSTSTGERRSLRGRRAMIATSVALAGVVAFGGAAAAGVGPGFVQGLFPWTSDNGLQCQVVANFEPRDTTDPNYSPNQDAALGTMREWAASFDLGSIDQQVANDAFLDDVARISADHATRAEVAASFVGDELNKHALLWDLDRRADQRLREVGFNPQSLNGGVGMKCDE